jgi:hypothetical protein
MRMASGQLTRVAFSLLAGLAIVVLFYPLSRVDIIPVQCSSAVGLGVPCEGALSLAAGAALTVLLSLLLWLRSRGAERS